MSGARDKHAVSTKIPRRAALRTAAAAGLAGALGNAGLIRPARAAGTTIVSWASAGQRWEFPEKGVYPLFQKKFPDIEVKIFAEPIADMLPKTTIALASKSDRYDVIFDDYNYSPQFIAEGALECLEPYLDKDPEYKKDIFADIPENVLDLYRDKPAAKGGKLYGLPPDSNCQMQYYRADVFEKAGLKPAETWDDVIAISQELSQGRQSARGRDHPEARPVGRRGFYHLAPLLWRRLVRQDGAGRLAPDARHRIRPQSDGYDASPGAISGTDIAQCRR